MSHVPFISDPGHLARLEGQRYVVLRPSGEVLTEYGQVRSSIRSLVKSDAVSSPSFPHVTFVGFPSGTSLDQIQETVARWVEQTPQLVVEIEGLSTFPPPFQTVIVQVAKKPPLERALSSIRDLSADSGLPQWPERRPSVEDWIFHMSVAYCALLSQEEWEVVADSTSQLPVGRAQCLVSEAEIVAYDGGEEHSGGAFAFSGKDDAAAV